MKINCKLSILIVVLILLLSEVCLVHFCQADVNIGSGLNQSSQVSSSNLGLIIGRIIKSSLALLGIIFVSVIIIAGTVIMISRGNQEKVLKAKKIIFSAVIGLIIILLSYAIIAYILKIFQPPNYIVGDVNGNGVIESDDVWIINLIALGVNVKCYDLDNHEINCIKVADVNRDGKVDNTDVELINKIIFGR